MELQALGMAAVIDGSDLLIGNFSGPACRRTWLLAVGYGAGLQRVAAGSWKITPPKPFSMATVITPAGAVTGPRHGDSLLGGMNAHQQGR